MKGTKSGGESKREEEGRERTGGGGASSGAKDGIEGRKENQKSTRA